MNLNLSTEVTERLHVRASQAWFRVDDYFIARDVPGIDHIIAELRRGRLDLALVSYDYFIREYLFSTRVMTYFI